MKYFASLVVLLLATFVSSSLGFQSADGLLAPPSGDHQWVVNEVIQPGQSGGAAGVTVKANGSGAVQHFYCNGIVNGERTHKGHHFINGDDAVIDLTKNGTKLTVGGDSNTVNFDGEGITGANVHVGGTNGTVNMNGNSSADNTVTTSPSGTINP